MASAASTLLSSSWKQSMVKPMFGIHRTVDAMRLSRKTWNPNLKIGFVPTMGALHEGHLSLMRQAREENDLVVASIFVNPTQFGPKEDLSRYPRPWERDLSLLQESKAIDFLFAPSHMYENDHFLFVDPGSFLDHWPEAKIRPGHFRGVATIVTKLFNIVQPHNAYFGQKDAAQCVLIRNLVRNLDMDIQVVIAPTVREPDGLAMSSRNAYLSPEERKAATVLYRALKAAQTIFSQHLSHKLPPLSIGQIKQVVENVIRQEPMVKEIQYIAVDDYQTMKPFSDQDVVQYNPKRDIIISLACVVGKVRLIDNIFLSSSSLLSH